MKLEKKIKQIKLEFEIAEAKDKKRAERRKQIDEKKGEEAEIDFKKLNTILKVREKVVTIEM